MTFLSELFDRRYLSFRSNRADVFRRASERNRLTPTHPDDITETNFRLEQVEEFATTVLNMMTSAYHHELPSAQRERLRDIPYRLAKYELMQIPGIGEAKAHDLLKCYGNLADIHDASIYEIADYVPGIGIDLAKRIKAYLHRL